LGVINGADAEQQEFVGREVGTGGAELGRDRVDFSIAVGDVKNA
jgi:hypothetical protein